MARLLAELRGNRTGVVGQIQRLEQAAGFAGAGYKADDAAGRKRNAQQNCELGA